MDYSDFFQRPDGPLGSPWVFGGSGAWNIVNGKAVHTSGAGSDAAVLDVGVPNVNVITPLSGANTGQFIRYIDINNSLIVVAGTGSLDGLWKIVAGVATRIHATVAILGNAILEVLCVDDTIRITSNDVIIGEYTLTAPEAAQFSTPTKFGFRAFGTLNQAHESIVITEYIGNVETYPADVSIDTAISGFGINVGAHAFSKWGYIAAKEQGATEVRWQFGWEFAETDFENPGTYPGFSLPIVTDALRWCDQLDLKPLVIAAYGPARKEIITVHVDGVHPVGSTQLSVIENLNDIELEVGSHYIGAPNLGLGRAAYYGGIITDIDENVVFLGAATIGVIDDNTPLKINYLMHPSVSTDSAEDPSAVAYASYVYNLALLIAQHCPGGGAIELWNEPPWASDSWDKRARFYDDPESFDVDDWENELSPLIKAVAALNDWPESVEVYSSGTHKSGLHSALNVLSKEQLRHIVANSRHPYCIEPESHSWGRGPTCEGTKWAHGYKNVLGNSSFPSAAIEEDLVGFRRRISECGFGGVHPDPDWYEAMKAYSLRFLVGSWSMGYEMVTFYSLADGNNYDMCDSETREPYPSLLRIGQFMQFLKQVKNNIGDYTLPVIKFYDGELPLYRVNIGPILVFWQRASADGPPLYTPHWPNLVKIHINEEVGSDLLIFNTVRRVHESVNSGPVGTKTLYVGAEPLVVTWKVSE